MRYSLSGDRRARNARSVPIFRAIRRKGAHMKAMRIYFELVGGKTIAMFAEGFRAFEATTQKEGAPKRYILRLGDAQGKCVTVGTNDRETPEVATIKRDDRPPVHLIHRMDFTKVRDMKRSKEAGQDVFFFTMGKETNQNDLRIALQINTKGLANTEGKHGTYTVANEAYQDLPFGHGVSGESTFLVGLTVIAPGETISITPEGGEPVLLHYDGVKGLVFEQPGTFAPLIAEAKPERSPQRTRRAKKHPEHTAEA